MSFNTDDGIRRAAISHCALPASVSKRFNTDDGIRRAAICISEEGAEIGPYVSIPMTVLGGLQCNGVVCRVRINTSFNTDDGIRRAAILMGRQEANVSGLVSIPMTVLGGLQLIRRKEKRKKACYSFNTDDGIRRAAMNLLTIIDKDDVCFNTDDGIRRAAIRNETY